jgi:Flp pilus assembly pilin Flp
MDIEAPITQPPPGHRLAEEDGAQAVEYAMIGGVGAGLIGLLWTLLQRTGLLDKVTATLVDAVVDLVKGWF